MKKEYLTLDDLLNEIGNQKHIKIEHVPAFSSFGEDLIEKLKRDRKEDEETVWLAIKNKQIDSDSILSIYDRKK